jgi:chromosome segregation ATPase
MFIEALGISYSNPYNIVQQGKINSITQMDEVAIFKLF